MSRQHAQYRAGGCSQGRSPRQPQPAPLQSIVKPRLRSHRRQQRQLDDAGHLSGPQPSRRRPTYKDPGIGIAGQHPRSHRRCRGAGPHIGGRDEDNQIGRVQRGLGRDPTTLPNLPRGQPLSAEASATMELLKVLLKASAARHRVAPRLIADSDDLERIASEADPDVPALRGWRRHLFGEDALKLKRGELALTLHKGEVLAISPR